jgi:hypothetical protein
MKKKFAFKWFIFSFMAVFILQLGIFCNENSIITINTHKILIKGFPAIVRVTATGPQKVPVMSLFDERGEISFTLKSKNHNKTYILSSSEGMDVTRMTTDGEMIDDFSKERFHSNLPKNEVRSFLVDLYSLSPRIKRGLTLSRIPPGSYLLKVSFPISGLMSEFIEIEILNPTKPERSFFEKTLKRGVCIRRGDGVNWSRALKDKVELKPEDIADLRNEVKPLIQFHLLAYNVLSRKITSSKEADKFIVPDHLKGEKESLLLELDLKNNPKDADKFKAAFAKKYPDIKWRHSGESNQGLFLRYLKRIKK